MRLWPFEANEPPPTVATSGWAVLLALAAMMVLLTVVVPGTLAVPPRTSSPPALPGPPAARAGALPSVLIALRAVAAVSAARVAARRRDEGDTVLRGVEGAQVGRTVFPRQASAVP